MSSSDAVSGRVLIAAFEGWSDAGGAATDTLNWLRERLDTEELAVLSSDDYVDFQSHRPRVHRGSDGSREIDWPDTKLYGPVIRPQDSSDEDAAEAGDARIRALGGVAVTEIFLLHGFEPSRHWRRYVETVMELCRAWHIDHIILLGSLFADAPHTRPISVSLTSENADLRLKLGCERSDYEGPVGISTIIGVSAGHLGIGDLACWASVPHYVHAAPSPKATLALLDRLEDLLDVVLPRGELIEQATEWEESISSLAEGDPEMLDYIERLERARDELEGPNATGEALAHEFEKFLRRDEDDPRSEN